MSTTKFSPALFLDRDGIINEDFGYVFKFEQFKMIPSTLELIKFAKSKNYKIIVLTNQSGIERNYYTSFDVDVLHSEIDHFFLCHGIKIDGWYYCPSLTGNDRKPNPGMMEKAILDHGIDPEKSFMLGDKESDVLHLKGPTYSLIKGNYEIDLKAKSAQIFNTHQEYLDFFKSLHR